MVGVKMIDIRKMAEMDFSQFCGDLCREAFAANNFTNLKQMIASPEFQLAVEVAKLQELIAKNNREALKTTIGDVQWQ